MKETEFTKLFDRYSQAVQVPTKPKRSKRRNRWIGAVAAVASLALIAAAIVFVPSAGVAAALSRVETAISNVDSMKMSVTMTRHGKTMVVQETFYQNKAWVRKAKIGTNLEVTILDSEGRRVTHYKRLSYATIGKPMDMYGQADMSAIDYVKAITDIGIVGENRDFSISSGPVIDGRSTYVLTGTKKNGNYYSKTFIDRATDLPIRADLRVEFDSYDYVAEALYEFSWNEELPSEIFDPEYLGVEIIDTDEGLRDLLASWQEPVTTVRDRTFVSDLLDVKISSAGEVYLISSLHNDGKGRSYLMPTELTDDTGNVYRRITDYSPGGLFGDIPVREAAKVNGGRTTITVFVPAETEFRATNLTINWTIRTAVWPGATDWTQIEGVGLMQTEVAAPDRLTAEFPEYSPVLYIDSYHFQTSFQIAGLRAETLFELGEFEGAIEWGWIAYERTTEFIPKVAYRELGTVIKSLEAAGRLDEAKELKEREAQERAKDIW